MKIIDEKLIWNDKTHSVGHPKLDEQHKMLFNLINSMAEQAITSHTQNDLKGYHFIFIELKKYIKFHIEFEENLLEEMGFSNLTDHRKLHNEFIIKIENLPFTSTDKIAKLELVHFLKDWWEHHILFEDMDYKKHLKILLD